MGMKPRLTDSPPAIDPKLVTSQNSHPGEESNPNIANTVSSHKVVNNQKLDPNLVSGPKC